MPDIITSGSDALDRMHQRLSSGAGDHGRLKELASKVCSFYGSALTLVEFNSPNSQLSEFRLDLTGAIPNVTIRLDVGSDRVTEALTHELLHAELISKGCPYPLVAVPDFTGCLELVNSIHHLLMYRSFQCLGLDAAKFYGSTPNKLWVKTYCSQPSHNIECYRLCLAWLDSLIDSEATGDESYIWNEHECSYARNVCSGFHEKASAIESWLDNNTCREHLDFSRAYNDVASIVPIEPVAEWVTVISEPDGPRVNRVIAT